MLLHHVAVKVPDELFETEFDFYTGLLGLPCLRRWPNGALLGKVGGAIELLKRGDGSEKGGALDHIAFSVESPAAWAADLTAAGLTITRGPEELVIGSEPPCPVEILFFRAPAGEIIELYHEKN